jgi:Tol biopolymer transport system component
MNADGSNVIKLTSRNKDDYQPHWSPDGNTIVFTEFYSGTLTIYKMDTNGGNLDTVTNGPYNESVVAWSPDSTSLLVYSKRHSPAISDLIVIDLNGNEIFNLSPNGDPGGAAFSPDGTKILFSVDGGSWQQTYIANADGTDINVLQCNGHPMFSWEYSWASTGDRFATTAYSSQAIVIRNLTTGTCEYITGGIYSIYLAWRP